jgi:hypothetical protein
MAQILDRETLDGRVVLNGTWEQFKLIQKVSEDSPGIKLYHLREDGYEQVIQSQLSGLETLDIDLLRRCILRGETDLAEAVKVFGQGISIDRT